MVEAYLNVWFIQHLILLYLSISSNAGFRGILSLWNILETTLFEAWRKWLSCWGFKRRRRTVEKSVATNTRTLNTLFLYVRMYLYAPCAISETFKSTLQLRILMHCLCPYLFFFHTKIKNKKKKRNFKKTGGRSRKSTPDHLNNLRGNTMFICLHFAYQVTFKALNGAEVKS